MFYYMSILLTYKREIISFICNRVPNLVEYEMTVKREHFLIHFIPSDLTMKYLSADILQARIATGN